MALWVLVMLGPWWADALKSSVRRKMPSEEATRHRMEYWHQQEDVPQPATDKYLLFSFDLGGLNNIRIAWEFSGLIAQRTGRTLVLPPAAPMYLLDNQRQRTNMELAKWQPQGETRTKMEDLINLRQLKGMLPTLTAAEFMVHTGLSWNEAVKMAEIPHQKNKEVVCQLSDYTAQAGSSYLFLDGKAPYPDRQPFVCSEWWLLGGPRAEVRRDLTQADWALWKHGFVWHKDAFAIAAKVVDYLGLFQYMALHARYGDFAEKQGISEPDQIYDTWRDLMLNMTAVYVATDQAEKFASFREKHGVKVVMWPDLFTSATGNLLVETQREYSPERWFKLTGLVEELVCTYAKVFIGTDRSSFSGHIQRMRLHAGSPVQQRLVHKNGSPGIKLSADRQVKVPMDAIRKEIEEWNRKEEAVPWSVPSATEGNTF